MKKRSCVSSGQGHSHLLRFTHSCYCKRRMVFVLLFFFVGQLALSTAECPPFLADVNTSSITGIDRIDEAIDTACGRRNFTSAFWSLRFVQMLIFDIVDDEKAKDNSSISLRPLYQSVKDQYKSLDKPDVKRYMDDLFKEHRKTSRRRFTGTRMLQMIMRMLSFGFSHRLSVESQIMLAQATKRAFGVVETEGLKQQRIDTAMKAIERFGTLSRHEVMADLFAKVFDLVNDNVGLGKTAFENLSDKLEESWNATTEISRLEVLPEIETLYIQYNTLNDADAKAFVDWYLASMALANHGKRTLKGQDFDDRQLTKALEIYKGAACPSQNGCICFKALSEEAKATLRSTFPELFAYLDKKMSLDNWAFGATGTNSIEKKMEVINQSEIEGSGQF